MRAKNNTKRSKYAKYLKTRKVFGSADSSPKKKRMRILKALTKSRYDRHKNKHVNKKNNIIKINAFLNSKGMKYSRFMNILKILKCDLNRYNIINILLNDDINQSFIDYIISEYKMIISK